MHRIPIVIIGLLLMLPLVLSPAPTTEAQSSPASQMETLVNQERGAQRVPTLGIHPALERAAANHNAQMDGAQTLCHTCLTDGSVSDQEIAAGYQPNPTAWGQTAGINYPTAQEQMADWVASSAHHDALLNPIYQHLGCNYSATAWADLWTCDLAAGGALAPTGSPVSDLETAINLARTSNGVATLNIDSRLEAAAQAKLTSMVNSGCYLLTCANERTPYERQAATGYPSTGQTGEMIDSTHPTAEGVIGAWMVDGSAPRFVLLRTVFTDLGCASGMAGSTPLWVCDLGQQATGSGPTSTPVRTATATAVPSTATVVPTATVTVVPPTATAVPTATVLPPTPTPVTDATGACVRMWKDSLTGAVDFVSLATAHGDCLD